MAAKKQNFMEGALVLMLGGIIVKIIGALFKIPLSNLLHGVGMSYFTVAYDIYTWVYIITTAGLPIAISRMVSESNSHGRYTDSKHILQVAFRTFFAFAIVTSGFLLIFAKQLADLMDNSDAVYCIIAVAPAILFEIIMSSNRGYFEGHKNMVPTAISQIITATAKLTFGYALAYILLKRGYGLPIAAAGAIFGVTIGGALGAIYLFFKRIHYKPERESIFTTDVATPRRKLLKRLLAITIPITIGSSVLSITNLIDTGMVMNRLSSAGIAMDRAKLLFGSYSALARTMFNLPTAVIIPMGVSVIPSLAEKFATGVNKQSRGIAESALRVVMILSVPAGFGLAMMSKPILSLLYSSLTEEVKIAAPLLTSLGPAVVFVCLVSITNAILQAIGKEKVPVVTMLIGGTMKLVCNYILVGTPNINISGAPFGTNLCYGTIALLNIIVIWRSLDGLPTIIPTTIKSVGSALVSCGVAALLFNPIAAAIGATLSTLICIIIAVSGYFIILLTFKGMNEEDILLLPKGEKIKKILAKYGWIG
ncbi:MAG: polysaccharide biosynthesis protein [Bacillota bacterium]|nr:polysaccharide biosynthesis protein [Bacillota bacterium]